MVLRRVGIGNAVKYKQNGLHNKSVARKSTAFISDGSTKSYMLLVYKNNNLYKKFEMAVIVRPMPVRISFT